MDCFASLAIRRMHVRDLAARCTRALPEVSLTLSKQRAQGMPGARCTRGLMCNGRKSAHMSIQGSGEHPTFPAQWLYGLLRVLPGERLFCLRSALKAVASRCIDASTATSGPHDFTVRSHAVRLSALPASDRKSV